MIQKPRKYLVKHIKQHGKKRGILGLIPLLYNLIISKMKNTYIVAIKDKETLYPYYFQMPIGNDISEICKKFWRVYVFDTKTKAKEIWCNFWKTYTEKQDYLNTNQ